MSTLPIWILEVNSSTIKKAAYNLADQTLGVEFKSGKHYVYQNVSVAEFEQFTLAPSQGKWFADNIKDVKTFDAVE